MYRLIIDPSLWPDFFCTSRGKRFFDGNGTIPNERAAYMERNKMLINKTNVPQYAIERVARCIYDDISADYAKPEVQAEFALWLAEREAKKDKGCQNGGPCSYYGK